MAQAAMPAPRLWEPPARPQPCLAGLGSGLNTHHLALLLLWSLLGMGFPNSSVGKESACKAGDPGLIPGVGKIRWRRDRLPTPVLAREGAGCGSVGDVPGAWLTNGVEGLLWFVAKPKSHAGSWRVGW